MVFAEPPERRPWEMYRACSDHPFVSIVVCTRGVRPLFKDCLDSLMTQKCERREILVVLNNDPNEEFSRFIARYPVRFLTEPRRGVSIARNSALEHAQGEILALVDDDVVAGPDWLHELVSGFQNPAVACVTGRVIVGGEPAYAKVWANTMTFNKVACSIWTLSSSDRDWYTQALTLPIGFGCNAAFRKRFLEQCCRFPQQMGAGSLIGHGDETWMFIQVLRGGYQIYHTPLASVTHFFPEDLAEQKLRAKEGCAGQVAFFLKLLFEEKGLRLATVRLLVDSLRRYLRSFFPPKGVTLNSQGVLSPREKLIPFLQGPWVFYKSRRS